MFGVEKNEVLLPLMASCLQAEVMAMLMMGKDLYPNEKITIVLADYQNYFRNWLDPNNVDSLPIMLRGMLSAIQASKHDADLATLKYQNWVCLRNSKMTIVAPQPLIDYDVGQTTLSGDPDDPAFIDALTQLRDSGYRFPNIWGRLRFAKSISPRRMVSASLWTSITTWAILYVAKAIKVFATKTRSHPRMCRPCS